MQIAISEWEDWIINAYESIKLTKSKNMRTDHWNSIFERIVYSWDEVRASTILIDLRVCLVETTNNCK